MVTTHHCPDQSGPVTVTDADGKLVEKIPAGNCRIDPKYKFCTVHSKFCDRCPDKWHLKNQRGCKSCEARERAEEQESRRKEEKGQEEGVKGERR